MVLFITSEACSETLVRFGYVFDQTEFALLDIRVDQSGIGCNMIFLVKHGWWQLELVSHQALLVTPWTACHWPNMAEVGHFWLLLPAVAWAARFGHLRPAVAVVSHFFPAATKVFLFFWMFLVELKQNLFLLKVLKMFLFTCASYTLLNADLLSHLLNCHFSPHLSPPMTLKWVLVDFARAFQITMSPGSWAMILTWPMTKDFSKIPWRYEELPSC